MRTKQGVPFLLLAMVLGPVASTARPPSAPAPAARPRPPAELRAPLTFEANRGQTDSRVRFMARGPGYRLFLTPSETVLGTDKAGVRLSALGANPAAVVEGLGRTSATATYLKAGSRTTAPTYQRVAVRGLYPGVDAVYYGNPHQLEYDYVVAPGADPGVLALGVSGADRVSLDEAGNLLLGTPTGTLTQHRPVAYQDVGGVRRPVEAAYLLDGSTVRLHVGAYDASHPLVIDPVITYSTYLGGTAPLGDDEGDAIAVDPAGNVYVTGHTASTDFPTLGGLVDTTLGGTDDAFVAKFGPAGNLLWATYFGGAGFEQGLGIAYDPTTNTVVVTGFTTSDQTTFPLVNPFDATLGGIQDAFVARFDAATGALVSSTYLGGSDVDVGYAVAVDSAGNPVVTGQTFSPDYPLAGAVFDPSFSPPSEAYVTKLTAAGNALVFSTFLGGTGEEAGYGIAVDGSDRVYVTGFTTSLDFPLRNQIQGFGGIQDAFVAAFNTVGGPPLYSTYFGGGGSDTGYGIDTDFGGTAYVTGQTSSAGLPAPGGFDATLGGPTDAFVAVFLPPPTPSLGAFTYLGGSGDEAGFGIALDASLRPIVTGFTSSADFPLLAPVDATFGGSEEAFVTRFNGVPLTLAYSTYLGGSVDEEGFGIAVNGTDAHVTGFTNSPDFPVVNAFDPTLGGVSDAFVTKLALETTPPTCALTAVIAGPPKQIQITVQDTGSGLASVQVTSATNSTVSVPPFAPGTTGPVVVTATKVDQNAGSQVVLQITDVDGNVTTCDPIDTPVVRDTGQPVIQTFGGVPQAEHKVQIVNGTPGVTTIELTVNGKRFGPFQLADGEERNFSIASAMKPGTDNTITVTARGKPGGSAALLVHD